MSRKRFDPEDEYDLDDDFVDDSDMFFGDVNYVPPKKWDFGFFAWRGRIENFFKEGLVQRSPGRLIPYGDSQC